VAEARGLLVVCGEPVGARMAGPAIRALELAGAVAASGVEVTLAAPAGPGPTPARPGVSHVSLTGASLGRLGARHRAVLIGPGILSRFPALARLQTPLAVDLYDPVPLEAAELFHDAPEAVLAATLDAAAANLRLELSRADLILCASPRQRDLWIGGLLALGRIKPGLYAADPALASLCRVVPFGVPRGNPEPGPPAIRGVLPGVGAEDPIFIWAGGLHDWFDPELAVLALQRLLDSMPNARLVFMAGAPPNQYLQAHRAGSRTRALAQKKKLLDTNVYFLKEWVPYDQRGRYLAEATVGLSTHRDTLESRYAWRTRLLDYLWAGLPVACTGGDPLGDLISDRGAGVAVGAGDVEALAAAMSRLAAPGRPRQQAVRATQALAQELRWEQVARPLVEWAHDPRRNAGSASGVGASAAQWRMLATKGIHVLRTEGVAGVRRRTRRFADRD